MQLQNNSFLRQHAKHASKALGTRSAGKLAIYRNITVHRHSQKINYQYPLTFLASQRLDNTFILVSRTEPATALRHFDDTIEHNKNADASRDVITDM